MNIIEVKSDIKVIPSLAGAKRLAAHDNTVAAGVGADILGVGVGARGVVIAAAGATAVEADALALAGDSVALAGAGGAVREGSAVAGDVAGGRRAVAEIGVLIGLVVGLVDGGSREARGEILDLLVVVQNGAGGTGVDGLGSLDLGDGERATLGDVAGGSAGRALGGRGALAAGGGLGGGPAGGLAGGRRLAGGGRLAGALGDVEDVEGATGGGLDGGLNRGVVGDVVAVDDVVVPVALVGLEGGAGEAESSLPGARLAGGLVLGEGKLSGVVVPGAQKVDGLDARGDAEREAKLSGRHFGLINGVVVLESPKKERECVV